MNDAADITSNSTIPWVLIVATLLLCHISQRFLWWALHPLRRQSQIPIVPHILPFFGNALSFIRDEIAFTRYWCTRFNSPIFVAHILGQDYIFMCDAHLLTTAVSGKYPQLSWEHVKYRIRTRWGMPHAEALVTSRTREGHKVYDKYLINTESLGTLFREYRSIMEEKVYPGLIAKCERREEGGDGASPWVQTSIRDFFGCALYKCTIETLYKGCDLATDECFDLLNKLNVNFIKLLSRPLFMRVLFPETLATIEEMNNEFHKQIQVDNWTSKAEQWSQFLPAGIIRDLMLKFDTLFGDNKNMADRERWREVAVPLWVALINTGPTIFWLVYQILADENAYNAVKKEIKDIIDARTTNHQKENGGNSDIGGSFSIDELNNQTPVLDSLLNETLRLRTTHRAFRSRVATRDVTLKLPLSPLDANGKQTLTPIHVRKGNMIMVPLPLLHRDTDVFGANAEEFQWDRFVPDNEGKLPTFYKNGKKLNGVGVDAWGAGPFICSGRKFAKLEIKLLVAHILKDYDVRFVGGKVPNKMPEMVNQDRGFSNGTLKEDCLIEFRKCEV